MASSLSSTSPSPSMPSLIVQTSTASRATTSATSTASSCPASRIRNVAPSDFPFPYCAYNAGILIPDLSSCCGDGENDVEKGRDSQVYVHNNCTQYCEVSPSKTSSWRACVINHYPEANLHGNSYPCFFEDDRIESNRYTSSNNPNDGDELDSATATGTDDESGAANVKKPSLTFMGWMILGLAVGAGFVG